MTSLRVLIADDELLARKRLLRLLGAIDDVVVVGECEDGAAVLARVREGDVDVVLLDVQMPGLTGLEALQLLPPGRPRVILCTAYTEHAVPAFEHGAIDYLVKPVEAARVKKALDRARERVVRDAAADLEAVAGSNGASAPSASSEPHPPRAALERLAIPTRQGIVLLDPRSVSHAVLEGELITVFTDDGEYLCDETLGDLHAKLPGFERVHRKAIVNLEHVVRLDPVDSGGFLARTRSGRAVEVSRQSARDLRRRLKIR